VKGRVHLRWVDSRWAWKRKIVWRSSRDRGCSSRLPSPLGLLVSKSDGDPAISNFCTWFVFVASIFRLDVKGEYVEPSAVLDITNVHVTSTMWVIRTFFPSLLPTRNIDYFCFFPTFQASRLIGPARNGFVSLEGLSMNMPNNTSVERSHESCTAR